MATIHQRVTDDIIRMLEAGTPPWRKSWKPDAPRTDDFFSALGRPLRATGEAYRGINTLSLWGAAMRRGFNSRHWMTYKSAAGLGAQVRKGARSELAFYVGRMRVEDQTSGDEKDIAFLKSYCVFNADEIDGLPARFATAPVAAPVIAPDSRMPALDAYVAHCAISLRHGGDRAFYSPALDFVQMPHLEQFDAPADYYATLLHEGIHWTSAATRCDRTLGLRFGDNAYAAEELVAELGAAFLCADLGVTNATREDHASYIASWLTVLKSDSRAIFKAATLAEAAAGYLHKLQPGATEAPAEAPEETALAA